MRRTTLPLGLLAVGFAGMFAGSPAARAAVVVSSTFDTSADGWSIADLSNGSASAGNPPTVVGTYTATYNSTGGNPGGYVSETDPSPNSYYYQAPAKFLGNQTVAENGTFSFDIKDVQVPGDNTFNTGESPLILVGATESLYLPDRTTISQTTFETLSYTLAPGRGFAVDGQGGTAATAADFASVLGSLQAVYVLGDYYDGADTSSLDNVTLATAVPEPASAGLVAVATTLLAMRRCRRRLVR